MKKQEFYVQHCHDIGINLWYIYEQDDLSGTRELILDDVTGPKCNDVDDEIIESIRSDMYNFIMGEASSSWDLSAPYVFDDEDYGRPTEEEMFKEGLILLEIKRK